MRGYTKDQYLEEVSDYFSIIHPEDRERIKKNLKVYSNGIQIRDEYRITTREKTERWCEQTYQYALYRHRAAGSYLVYTDVTAEKKAEMSKNMHLITSEHMTDMPADMLNCAYTMMAGSRRFM